MTASADPVLATCPACGSTKAARLEHIALTEQHRSYSPGNTSTANELTRLANIPGNQYQMLRCHQCGLEFCDPFVAPGNDWYQLVYQTLSLYPGERWEFDFVPIQLSRHDSIGEIGCGSGEFLKLCRVAGIPAAGVDFSKDAIDACIARGFDAKLMDVSGEASAFIEASRRTTIVAFQVLEHLASPASLFALASRWSTPDASLWVAIPSNRRPARLFQERDFLDQPPHHMTRWTEASLKLVGERNGWKLARILYEPMNLLARVWWIATRTAAYKAFAATPLVKIRPAEWAVRALIYPWALIRSFTIGDSMSGQTMMAQYSKA